MAKDYRYYDKGADSGVELIVRRNNTYGDAQPGESVLVDARELLNPSTMSACYTKEEFIREQQEFEEILRAKMSPQASSTSRVISSALEKLRVNTKREELDIEMDRIVAERNEASAPANVKAQDEAARREAERQRELSDNIARKAKSGK